MWNKRKANGLLFLEVLLAFIVLFAVYTFASFSFEQSRSPLGFEYENGLQVEFAWEEGLDSLDVLALQQRVQREVNAIEGVEAVAFIGTVGPFTRNTWQTVNSDNGFDLTFKMFFGDEYLPDAAGLNVVEGRWFNESDESARYNPIVINRAFKEAYFPGVNTLIDSVIYTSGQTKIVGMVEDFKYYSNFAERVPLAFFSQRGTDFGYEPFRSLWVRTTPGRKVDVQEAIYEAVLAVTKNSSITIKDLSLARKAANRPTIIPLVIVSLIAGFLLINTALGLFGVLFTQINRRRAEIGLRKALGATPGGVMSQFVVEVLLVAAAALLLGTLFAVQLPLLDLVPLESRFLYYGIGGAVLTILLVVTLCALLPSLQAARLHPAHVLHED